MGELQKRIKIEIDDACPSEHPNFLDIARWQFEPDVNKIIEEMRREFPRIVLGNELVAVETVCEVMTWKEKWLGESDG